MIRIALAVFGTLTLVTAALLNYAVTNMDPMSIYADDLAVGTWARTVWEMMCWALVLSAGVSWGIAMWPRRLLGG